MTKNHSSIQHHTTNGRRGRATAQGPGRDPAALFFRTAEGDGERVVTGARPAAGGLLSRAGGQVGATATNATSHGRRSFLVVMAASWRSRQRPSPLRGGHGGGLCPFVVVTAEVFYTSTQKQRKKSLHMRLPPFSSQEPAWGLRLITALAPPGDFFGEIIEKKKKKAEKKPPPLAVGGGHVAVFAAPPWRSRRSFADTAGGLSWRSFLVFQFGG